ESGKWLGDEERTGGQRPVGTVALPLVPADPVPAFMPALHVRPPGGDRVALDRLAGKRVAFGSPVLEGPGLEVEVERFALGIGRGDPPGLSRAGQFFRRWRWRSRSGVHEKDQGKAGEPAGAG